MYLWPLGTVNINNVHTLKEITIVSWFSHEKLAVKLSFPLNMKDICGKRFPSKTYRTHLQSSVAS